MFPIRDHNPSRSTPYVTWALIALNILVFLSYWHLFANERLLMAFFADWAMIPDRVMRGAGWETLLTAIFLHGSLFHLLGNMLFLWVFGDNLEDRMGRIGFLAFYLACGLGAGLAQIAADPGSRIPMVGASGAIAGVMGGYLLLFPRARVDVLFVIVFFIRILPIPAWMVLGAWFALQVLYGSIISTAQGGVAYWAHAGGFALGLALTLPLWLRLGGPGYWARTHGHPDHPEGRYRLSKSSIPVVRRRK